MAIDLEKQIECIEREIGLREKVYPRWVESKRMSQKKADYEINAMREVLATIQNVRDTRCTLSCTAVK